MKYAIICLLMVSFSSLAFATMASVTIDIPAGETLDITDYVQWPANNVIAHLSPAAHVNGEVTEVVGFCQDSKVGVTGPTTVTIEYGSLDLPVASEPAISTPDAIGGGE